MSTTTRTRPAWLSQAEAADELGVTDRTIRNYIARGVLPAFRPRGSRAVRIRATDLEALMQPIPTMGTGADMPAPATRGGAG
ncbi:hypothetical protein N864_10830 [Intrasporangium chromatireducens Q5-1]|uniref:Helix-turn-helix domain-containing protein n=1 Tax=Intrasporangium chromatireducens Q5-1 TaxID=584657 RepID=W9GF25_9MICO|nr:hypothetical protein N864_10830 [Intrasporangium chromatireducens Q5-1]